MCSSCFADLFGHGSVARGFAMLVQRVADQTDLVARAVWVALIRHLEWHDHAVFSALCTTHRLAPFTKAIPIDTDLTSRTKSAAR